jgi:hypothetical protein
VHDDDDDDDVYCDNVDDTANERRDVIDAVAVQAARIKERARDPCRMWENGQRYGLNPLLPRGNSPTVLSHLPTNTDFTTLQKRHDSGRKSTHPPNGIASKFLKTYNVAAAASRTSRNTCWTITVASRQ